mmetsp:Transcript_2321/g.3992  ORF Transcript_2321/g.3992 Transcript_2321/m.3992 type:complete len:113 (+) Transcript_2321:52-390(+)
MTCDFARCHFGCPPLSDTQISAHDPASVGCGSGAGAAGAPGAPGAPAFFRILKKAQTAQQPQHRGSEIIEKPSMKIQRPAVSHWIFFTLIRVTSSLHLPLLQTSEAGSGFCQ